MKKKIKALLTRKTKAVKKAKVVAPKIVTPKTLKGVMCLALKPLVNRVEERKDYPGYKAFDLPEQFLLLEVCEYTKPVKQLRIFDGVTIKNLTILETLEFETLGDTTTIFEAWYKYSIDNLPELIPYRHTIGSDPEIFVEDVKGDIVPAFHFLKEKPGPELVRYDEKTAMHCDYPAYWDGFQAEFETRPNTCMGWHGDAIQNGLKKVLVAARLHDKNAKLSLKTVMNIPDKLLKESKPEHVQFGCMPSLNIYGLEAPKRDGREVDFRMCGGHIHFGIGKRSQEEIAACVKSLDAILAVACVSLFASFDDPKRRILYGLPGEYRNPAHGIEYRTLSNAWLAHPVIAHMVFDLGRKALSVGLYNLFPALKWRCSEEETIRIVRECDVEASRKVLDANKPVMIQIFKSIYGDANMSEAAFSAFRNGMESILITPTDIIGNWDLDKAWATHCKNPNKMFSNAFYAISQGKKVA
jgi:hypothetical protein